MWLANLSSGKTIAERDMEWDDLPIEEITCLHLVNGSSSAFIRAREGYQFFQYKSRSMLVNVATGESALTPIFWQRIGAVINQKGDCIYVQTDAKGNFDTRFDNVVEMKLNLPALRIHLHPEIISQKQKEMIQNGTTPEC